MAVRLGGGYREGRWRGKHNNWRELWREPLVLTHSILTLRRRLVHFQSDAYNTLYNNGGPVKNILGGAHEAQTRLYAWYLFPEPGIKWIAPSHKYVTRSE